MSSSLITNPAPDVDTYARQIEDIVFTELNKVAPERKSNRVHRSQPCDIFLSAAAITAKRERRRLEWLWTRW